MRCGRQRQLHILSFVMIKVYSYISCVIMYSQMDCIASRLSICVRGLLLAFACEPAQQQQGACSNPCSLSAGAEEGSPGASRGVPAARRPRPGGPDRARQGAGAARAARQRRCCALRRPRGAGRRRAPRLSLRADCQEMLCLCLPQQVGLCAALVYSALGRPRGAGRTPCLCLLSPHARERSVIMARTSRPSLSFHAPLSHVARCGLCAYGVLCPLLLWA